MFGLINLRKPQGFTSRDCVNIVSRNFNERRVGHAGTLDPIAEGVLIIAVGRATRLIEFIQEQRKSYTGTFQLGVSSPSVDGESEVSPCNPDVRPTREQLQAACDTQFGPIEQQPPSYSAVKISGVRAYELARRGVDVDMPSRTVHIFSCNIINYSYPYFDLSVECGSGTYIRSIGRDIASQLGTGAIMTALTRTAIGPFSIKDSRNIEEFRVAEPCTEFLQPASLAVAELPRLQLPHKQLQELAQGKIVEIATSKDIFRAAVFDDHGNLCSIVERRGNSWKAAKNFNT